MKFWDTSAVIPLLVDEAASSATERLFADDSSLVVWWGTPIECVSALARLERETRVSTDEAEAVLQRLRTLRASWREVQPSSTVKTIAERILRLHPLRAQDAQQLAACIMIGAEQPVEFVTLDERLRTAALKEGMRVQALQSA